jgi:hypothetical protein
MFFKRAISTLHSQDYAILKNDIKRHPARQVFNTLDFRIKNFRKKKIQTNSNQKTWNEHKWNTKKKLLYIKSYAQSFRKSGKQKCFNNKGFRKWWETLIYVICLNNLPVDGSNKLPEVLGKIGMKYRKGD